MKTVFKQVRGVWLVLCAVSAFSLVQSVQAVSFDCTKVKSKVEHLVCGNSELSRLDEELDAAYATSRQDKKKADEIQRAQRQWSTERNECSDVECVRKAYVTRLSVITSTTEQRAQPLSVSDLQRIEMDRKAGFKGEYFLTRNEDPICIPFTKNLNQFRKLDFDECHPRLSERFPEFSRPQWKEVPLDLDVAEKAFKGYGGSKLAAGEGTYWKNWLSETAQLRAAGLVKMWLTEVDINHDGVLDPIARVQYAHPASDRPVKQRGCMYTHSGLWKLSPSTGRLHDGLSHFYFRADADIIHFKETGRNYSVNWAEGQVGPILQGQEIGATRGVLVELSREARSTPIPVCHINWVPTGSYRPLQRKTRSSQTTN